MKKIYVFLLIGSVFLNILYTYSHFKRKALLKEASDGYKNEALKRQHARLNQLHYLAPIHNSDIVFLGTSLTNGFEVSEIFSKSYLKNRGVPGFTTKNILDSMDLIIRSNPRKIFLESGINDLEEGVSPNELLVRYDALVKKIKTESPDTKIFVTSIFPVGISADTLNPKIIESNQLLTHYCQDSRITFIDVYDRLSNNGRLGGALSYDDIHLNGNGYAIWKSCIDSLIN